MAIEWISTQAMRDATRALIPRTQASISSTSVEASTGRHFDVGRSLGTETGHAINLRNAMSDIDAIRTSNGIISEQNAIAQSALTAMTELANGFFKVASTAASYGTDRSTFVEDARSRLATLTSLLSTTSNGAYVFGGANSTENPVPDYLSQPTSSARTAVWSEFTSEFGYAPGDAAAVTISPGQMKAFLDGSYAALFEDPSWQQTFSSASGIVKLRIGPREIVQSTLSANDKGVRQLMSTLIAASDLGSNELNAETFQSFATSLAGSAAEAAGELTRSQAANGLLQERISGAGARMQIERGLMERSLGNLENVDQAEASTRLSSLMNQLEVSYAVTARIQNLSLLNYL